ncbi:MULTISPECIES: type II toxin-antitoxin system mRNA interferase toxin, RelE/StbE family [unclassified Legionella]|uniref:type II toxin-antitoxin system mRNA interferase toxin, RelE/StbE family n=1 Tax=unclassified Legionella TaxID=2622702 RepID=UPI001E3C6390|nr:type II toxin-antitoxin system mRNA interferase toxin, RelE/StbE family [Legionella sp. 31fI33]MCC5015108.1 type II toxin-antitoxin system mRNA interferase toxin, RelE/StbE family [Legionella sp. 31fI33]
MKLKNTVGIELIKPCQIELTKVAQKDLTKVPGYIKEKLLLWIDSVERLGIGSIRTVPGYHDEPLKGERSGQRSIRLNKAYRAIYIENEQKEIVIISIIEVNKHDY